MTSDQFKLLAETISSDAATGHDIARALNAHIYAQGFHDGLRQALNISRAATSLPTIEA